MKSAYSRWRTACSNSHSLLRVPGADGAPGRAASPPRDAVAVSRTWPALRTMRVTPCTPAMARRVRLMPSYGTFALNEQRRHHARAGAEQLDQHVQARSRRVLERVTDRVADDGRLVGIRALPAVLAGLDELLGVVPRAAAVVQERRHQDATHRAHHEQRCNRLGADVEGGAED